MNQPAFRWWKSALLMMLFPLLMLWRAAAQSAPFDIVITNGRIIDGTGSPWFSGDIGPRLRSLIVAVECRRFFGSNSCHQMPV